MSLMSKINNDPVLRELHIPGKNFYPAKGGNIGLGNNLNQIHDLVLQQAGLFSVDPLGNFYVPAEKVPTLAEKLGTTTENLYFLAKMFNFDYYWGEFFSMKYYQKRIPEGISLNELISFGNERDLINPLELPEKEEKEMLRDLSIFYSNLKN